ncbi:MAG TPA: hypothetical protein VK123_07215 [Candidatus Limnocylindrales bacterium]|nr:hypothetical protein [Candidatus Limnocylindrales bacterium]
MNDTDAVITDGLFPIIVSGAGPLYLDAVSIRVRPFRSGMQKSFEYVVRNAGRSDTYTFGFAWGDSAKISVDGSNVRSISRVGRLVDNGDRVRIDPKTQAEIDTCNRYNDGNICGHEWVEFTAKMSPGQVRRIHIVTGRIYGGRSSAETILAALSLYSEKFWAGTTIPRVQVTLQTTESGLDARLFKPRGHYARYSRQPQRANARELGWTFIGYKPVKKRYGYVLMLVHPFAVDTSAIRIGLTSPPQSVPH